MSLEEPTTRFPNDRVPTPEELKTQNPSKDWFIEKGPLFSSEYLAHRGKKVNGDPEPSYIRGELRELFGAPKTELEWDNYAVDAYMKYR